MDLHLFQSFLHTLLSPYGIDEKWYPFILIGVALLVLLLVYIIFMYIRAFVSWISGNSEIVAEEKYQTTLLEEMLITQKEQLDILQALFIENTENEEENVNLQNSEKPTQPKKKYYHHHRKPQKKSTTEKNPQ